MTKRKDGLWQEAITINGQRKYFYGKTKAEVLRKISAFENKRTDGRTFDEAADIWLEAHSAEVSYKTNEGYNAPLKRLRAAFGDDLIKDITPAQIKAFVSELARKGYTRSTVQRPLNIMSMIFDYEITQPDAAIRVNPCHSVKLPSGLEQNSRDLPDPADISRIKSNVALPFGLFAYLLVFSGLRKGEALALTDKDIDLKNNEIVVTKSVSWQNGKAVIKEPKTKSGRRKVILLTALKKHIPKFTGYLFSADGGVSPLSETQFRNRWEKYCQQAGLADVEVIEFKRTQKSNLKNSIDAEHVHTYYRNEWTYHLVPHQLRHEFCTICYDADIPAKELQRMMGHAKLETTENIYTHIRQSREKSSAEKLNQYINDVYGG